jgi:hypothetical protein
LSPDTSPIRVDPQTLKPHPRYRKIYGSDEDISQLVESIRASGWLRPLLITPKRTIVSGHRRWRLAPRISSGTVVGGEWSKWKPGGWWPLTWG